MPQENAKGLYTPRKPWSLHMSSHESSQKHQHYSKLAAKLLLKYVMNFFYFLNDFKEESFLTIMVTSNKKKNLPYIITQLVTLYMFVYLKLQPSLFYLHPSVSKPNLKYWKHVSLYT